MNLTKKDLKQISDRIRAGREKNNFTAEVAGFNSGLALQTIKNSEAGKHDFNISTLIALSKTYGESTDYILGLKESDEDDDINVLIKTLTPYEKKVLFVLLQAFRKQKFFECNK